MSSRVFLTAILFHRILHLPLSFVEMLSAVAFIWAATKFSVSYFEYVFQMFPKVY